MLLLYGSGAYRELHSFPTRRSSDLLSRGTRMKAALLASLAYRPDLVILDEPFTGLDPVVRDELIRGRSEEHTSELQSLAYLVCRLLLEKKKTSSAARQLNRSTV